MLPPQPKRTKSAAKSAAKSKSAKKKAVKGKKRAASEMAEAADEAAGGSTMQDEDQDEDAPPAEDQNEDAPSAQTSLCEVAQKAKRCERRRRRWYVYSLNLPNESLNVLSGFADVAAAAAQSNKTKTPVKRANAGAAPAANAGAAPAANAATGMLAEASRLPLDLVKAVFNCPVRFRRSSFCGSHGGSVQFPTKSRNGW